MGLDGVELIIRFEDAFGVAIPDSIAAELTTPRLVTEYLVSQLKVVQQTTCTSQQAFHQLRKQLLPLTAVQRREFRPGTKLTHVFPVDRRKQTWAIARSQPGVSKLPDLVRPGWLVSLLTLVTIVTAVLVFNQFRTRSASGDIAILASILVSVAIAYGSALITRPLKSQFSREYTNLGDLADYLAIHSPHAFKKEWTREEVAETVRRIIVDQTGLHEFHEDSRFVQDMHLD